MKTNYTFLYLLKKSYLVVLFFAFLVTCKPADVEIEDGVDKIDTVDSIKDTIPQTDTLVVVDTIPVIDTIIDPNADPIPDSSFLYSKTPVEAYGQLHVKGTKIVTQYGKSIQLRGMSFFWSQWIGKYYNYDCVKWLRNDWRCTVVRAAMAVESDGYLANPEVEKQKVIDVVDAAIELGIYVIIDWHDHNAQNHQSQAVSFFTEMARLYCSYPNVIYEPFNEPLEVAWNTVLKPYHEAVIAGIRQYDPDNIVICGTRTWSQQVSEAAQNPLSDPNVAYTLHYYASTHKQWLRNNAQAALNKGVALWVTEYGTTESSGTGYIDVAETNAWWDFMDKNQISWCNWSVADKSENSAALLPGASATGGWTEAMITTSGKMVRNELRAKNPPE
jgi:endoglucanase